MVGQLYINDKDAFTSWGACLESGSENALQLPAPNKEYVSNKSRSQHGKQVARKSPRKDERDVILYFCLSASTRDQFLMRFQSLIDELDSGITIIRVPRLKQGYKLDAISYQELSFYDKIGRFAVKFNEPNPQDRIQL